MSSSKYEEYRRNAHVCMSMARTCHEHSRAGWLKLAAEWLKMIPHPGKGASDTFDRMLQEIGTRQRDSNSSH